MIRLTVAVFIFLSGCAHFNKNLSKSEGHTVPLYFPITKEDGQFYAIPCTVHLKSGHCILDTGMDKTQVATTPDTSQFKTLSQAKSVSMYGERIESVVEIPTLTLAHDFTKKNIPALRSNSFHNLPEYLAVIGSDIVLGINFIFDFGKDDNNPAKIIFEPNESELAAFQFKEFDRIIKDERFITINLIIEDLNVKAIWDTHAPVSAFSTNFIQAHLNFFKIIESRQDKDAHAGKGLQNFYQLLKPVCITSKYCPYTTNYVVEHRLKDSGKDFESYDVILGNDFILSFNWYFDFKNKKYFVSPR